MNEARIQKLLFEKHCATGLVVPNAYFRNHWWEMDVLVVTKAGLAYEYEIKCTHADFLNEMKNKSWKHTSKGQRYITRYKPNYYYFICPEGVIKKKEVVDTFGNTYGLIYIVKEFHLKTVIKAKKIHDERVMPSEHMDLARKMMYKLFNHSDKYRIRKKV